MNGTKYPPEDFVNTSVKELSDTSQFSGIESSTPSPPYCGHYADRVELFLDDPQSRLRLFEKLLMATVSLKRILVCFGLKRGIVIIRKFEWLTEHETYAIFLLHHVYALSCCTSL